jgi:hypothetical protein
MRKVKFLKPGAYMDWEKVYFTSKHRKDATRKTIFHNNDKTSIYTLPGEFFKTHFKYNYAIGKYETKLKYGEIAQFCEVLDHRV